MITFLRAGCLGESALLSLLVPYFVLTESQWGQQGPGTLACKCRLGETYSSNSTWLSMFTSSLSYLALDEPRSESHGSICG